jgi:hypothetical protein
MMDFELADGVSRRGSDRGNRYLVEDDTASR